MILLKMIKKIIKSLGGFVLLFLVSLKRFCIAIYKSLIPSYKELKFFGVISLFFLLFLSLGYYLYYLNSVKAFSLPNKGNSPSNYQSSRSVDSVTDSFFSYLTHAVSGCAGLSGFVYNNPIYFSELTKATGIGVETAKTCESYYAYENSNSNKQSSNMPPMRLADFGLTGRLINFNQNFYSVRIANPGDTVNYYASRIQNVTYAQDNPEAGRNVLAPIFILNQNMVNLAYGLVVIMLLVSSLNLLVSNLTGQSTNLTLIQIITNSIVTLIVITFYYEISAIIYDLTVNYGNALVAGILSPFVNSFAILDRLSPGGDLSVLNILGAYQFIGFSDGIRVIFNSILLSALPLIYNSGAAISDISNLPVLSQLFGAYSAIGSTGIAAVLNYILGDEQIFTAVIAWVIFFINMKIFFNLIISFITFTMLVGFGPLTILTSITDGFSVVTQSFKRLIALGLVFPTTFSFILLTGIMLNLYITTPKNDINDKSIKVSTVELCRFSMSEKGASSVVTLPYWEHILPEYSGISFYYRNTAYQNIIDVTPANIVTKNGVTVRDCRPSLFPTPWAFIPAPFGNIGNRSEGVQTIDVFVRTILSVIFLVIASRAPDILEEVLKVRKLSSLSGLEKSFSQGLQSLLTTGFLTFKLPSVGFSLIKGLSIFAFKGGKSLFDFGKNMKDKFKKQYNPYGYHPKIIEDMNNLYSTLVKNKVDPALAASFASTIMAQDFLSKKALGFGFDFANNLFFSPTPIQQLLNSFTGLKQEIDQATNAFKELVKVLQALNLDKYF